MGNQKQKWTQEEEDALLAGVGKHGPGKWKNILRDPEFAPFLTHRSNIDLKDKWRNLSVSNGTQGSKDKQRTPKVKAVTAVPLSSTPKSAATPIAQDASSDAVIEDPSNSYDSKTAPKYNAMILEALSSIKDTNGSDISTIVRYIEQKHEVPQNFRRLLSSKMRRLIAQGKVEKVGNCYRIRKETVAGIKTPSPKQKEIRPRQTQSCGLVNSGDTVEEAATAAAYMVADAENRSFVAAEAVKEAERVAKMAEETDSFLQLVKETYEQCSRGGVILVA